MSQLRILDEAASELDAAVEYIERERRGYGQLLLDEYAEKLRQIQSFPHSGPVVSELPRSYTLRAFSLQTFRYSIIVGEIDGMPTIIAFAHQNRAPDYWHSRLG